MVHAVLVTKADVAALNASVGDAPPPGARKITARSESGANHLCRSDQREPTMPRR